MGTNKKIDSAKQSIKDNFGYCIVVMVGHCLLSYIMRIIYDNEVF